ncbi:MAG: sigma-70 family RNA polymerase sigma factor [Gemmatimonadetes bacterium]|nr:sigma-70 family RNA polymerase sigma factor [Gemmatimonadota bacterium]
MDLPHSERNDEVSDARPFPDLESTAELVAQIREGDGRALDRLLTRYLPRMKRWATGRIPGWARDMGDTEDLVQETVIGVLGRLDEFEMRGEGALGAYMRRAVLNRVRNRVRDRKTKPLTRELGSDLAARRPSPLEETIGNETLQRYEEALAKLAPQDAEAVHLRVELRYTYREIAGALGKNSEDAARMTVSRALVKLAEEMGYEPGS